MLNKIKSAILPFDQPSQSIDSLKCAAVLMPLLQDPGDKSWQVLFTRRALHLKHHPGQISFPGGRYEEADQELHHTALRETFEEIGIEPSKIELIGKLPQQTTISQYNMTPYVGVVSSDYQLTIDPNEVAEVFTVPLEFVIAADNQKKVSETINGTQYSFYVIRYNDYTIWGATARILVNLTRRLASRSTR